ncbi:MAG: class I SAM-dependent methyltransferase [Bacteroidetes bacterium]|nr:class I SAM-dependent methyltransferase [Bacteroidota bacterium]
MSAEDRYIEVNRTLWNAKTAHHVTSDFYDMPSFMVGATSLKEVELALLGDIKGKDILHLQCHFGQDTLSLARMGANVTGVDFSDKAIDKARELNDALGLQAQFIWSDVYELPKVHHKQYDIVFTTYGTIGWLPDMNKWAGVVSQFLKPGGKLILVELHPVVWMFDNEFTHIQYPYFNKEAIVETLQGTYADKNAPIALEEIGWNHPLSEVMQALVDNGLKLADFREYDFVPYNCLANMVQLGTSRYQIKGMEGKLPLLYSLVASKP